MNNSRQKKKEMKSKKRALKLKEIKSNSSIPFDIFKDMELVSLSVSDIDLENNEFIKYCSEHLTYRLIVSAAKEDKEITKEDANNLSFRYRNRWKTDCIKGKKINRLYLDKDDPVFRDDGICINDINKVFECLCGNKYVKNAKYFIDGKRCWRCDEKR